jgi:aminoglycoside 6'-N-acetyltransferase
VAAAAITAKVTFRPLTITDLPALLSWQHAPHAVRWFPERLDLAAAERKYGPRIAGDSPVRVHVIAADGQDCGYIQHYRVGDVGPDAIGLDFAIGIADLTGRGLGPQLIWSYIRDVALPAHPAARHVVASPDPANTRSIRALAKAGFEITADGGPGTRCVLDVAKFFGERAEDHPMKADLLL